MQTRSRKPTVPGSVWSNTFRSHKQYSPAICINTVFVNCQRVKQIMKTLIHAGVVDIKSSQCITDSHNVVFSFGLLVELSGMKSPSAFNQRYPEQIQSYRWWTPLIIPSETDIKLYSIFYPSLTLFLKAKYARALYIY